MRKLVQRLSSNVSSAALAWLIITDVLMDRDTVDRCALYRAPPLAWLIITGVMLGPDMAGRCALVNQVLAITMLCIADR